MFYDITIEKREKWRISYVINSNIIFFFSNKNIIKTTDRTPFGTGSSMYLKTSSPIHARVSVIGSIPME